MADDELEEVKPKKKKPIILYVIIGLVVVLELAGGTAYYVVTHYINPKPAVREPGTLMKLGDPKEGFIVNIGPANSGRYLKIGVILELKPNKDAAADAHGGKGLSPEEIKIQDAALHVLRSQKVEDLDPSKQERLKEAIKQAVNKALEKPDAVYEVYITTLLVQ